MEVKSTLKGPRLRSKKKQISQKSREICKKKKVKEEEEEEKIEARSQQALHVFSYFSKLKDFFKRFTSLSYWINGLCLAFVIWQTIKCMTKYIEKPKGTEISMKQSADVPFPVITVCGQYGATNGHYGDGINKSYLQNVCGIR